MHYFKRHRVVLLASCLYALFACSPPAITAKIQYQADFENQTFDGLSTAAVAHSHMVQRVNAPARTGKVAAKFTLSSDEAPGYLYGSWESHVVSVELEKYDVARIGDTRWYGFSISIDPSWRDDTKDPNGTVMAQWHRVPDPGENFKSPQLDIVVKGTRWNVINNADPHPITTESPKSYTRTTWDAGQVVPGTWTDWVVYAKWSYQADGVLKVWKDGSLVVDYRGPNTYNDTKREMFKFGIYKAWWNLELPAQRNTLIAYHDSIKIGDANSSYAEVAPPLALQPSSPQNLRAVDVQPALP
jgi:hypothetical protein